MTEWYWLSWARGRFYGGAFVPGATLMEAVDNSFRLRISPGSDIQVAGRPVPDDDEPDAKWRCRLLSEADIDTFDRETMR